MIINYYQYILPQKEWGKSKKGIYYLPFQYDNSLLEVDNSPSDDWQIVIDLDWNLYLSLSYHKRNNLQLGVVYQCSNIVKYNLGMCQKAYSDSYIKLDTQPL